MRTHRPCRGCGETISAKYYLCIDCMHEKGRRKGLDVTKGTVPDKCPIRKEPYIYTITYTIK